MNQSKDIIVIGGGIIGISAAYYLSKQGRSVTLIEREDIDAGCSYGNAGLIANGFVIPLAAPGVPSQGLKWLFDSASPFYIKPRLDLDLIGWLWKFLNACNNEQMRRSIHTLLSLGQGSLDVIDDLLAEEDVDFGYEHKGRLILFTSENGFKKEAAKAAFLREFGVNVTLLDADGVQQIEPNVLPSVKHGIYCPTYAHLTPDRFVHEMADLAIKYGVELKTKTEVIGFERSAQQITSVITPDCAFTPNQVVLAAGAWSPVIAHGLNLKLPIQPAKGYSLSYKRPPSSPRLPLSLSERKIAVTPMGDRLRFTSTLELVGFDSSINQPRLERIRRSVNEYLPGMEHLEQESAWYGYRPSTPDGLPVIGRSGYYENLILATGHGTLGMTHGLITGKLVSQIIAGEEPYMDLTAFRAERFSTSNIQF